MIYPIDKPHLEPTMHTELRRFLNELLPVILATLMVVATTTFFAVPYQLMSHPGDADGTQALEDARPAPQLQSLPEQPDTPNLA
ncbi:MAG: hypothetical protein Fur007_11610 [Rhodoferax sp.]